MKNKSGLTVLCDVDSVVANLLGPWLTAYNNRYGRSISTKDITDWWLEKCVPDGVLIYDILHTPGLYRSLDPLPGAIGGLKSLHDAGHHVILLTACANKNENAVGDKLIWIREYLPWLSYKDVIVGFHKHLIRGDVLIDDSPENIRKYQEAWPEAKIVTIDYPYNRNAAVNFRAMDYVDTSNAWKQIVEYVSQIGSSNLKGES